MKTPLLQPNERFWEKASGKFPLLIEAEQSNIVSQTTRASNSQIKQDTLYVVRWCGLSLSLSVALVSSDEAGG